MQGINGIHTGMDVGKKASNSNPTYPVLLQRIWVVGPGYSAEITPDAIPAGTKYIRASGVAPGGHYSNTIVDGGGAGGAFVSAVVPYQAGSTLAYFVGQYGNSNIVNRATSLQMGGQMVINAPATGIATTASSGSAVVSGAIGDVIRSGTNGSAKLGGNSGTDLTDAYSMGFVGIGAQPTQPAQGWGAGCAVQQTSPSTANYFDGTDGAMAIEFWTGDPR